MEKIELKDQETVSGGVKLNPNSTDQGILRIVIPDHRNPAKAFRFEGRG